MSNYRGTDRQRRRFALVSWVIVLGLALSVCCMCGAVFML